MVAQIKENNKNKSRLLSYEYSSYKLLDGGRSPSALQVLNQELNSNSKKSKKDSYNETDQQSNQREFGNVSFFEGSGGTNLQEPQSGTRFLHS
jgi:hypothetical protein